ncbi:MAG: Ldh family oxidoreductase [Verrucomicrobiota bacterium]|nr:Ldh family oxidoreductase [Verrucomicrobiota bacterium]
MDTRYDRTQLISFATKLMLEAGMEAEKAMDVANILMEGDLMGHTTHGLQMLVPYLKSMESGEMTLSGNYSVIKDTGNNIVIEGHFLPGPWLVKTAIEKAATRMQEHGVVTTAITHSHHIACLQAYLPLATSQGWMITLMSSDPSVATVAPFGGKTPLLTPNPIAVGIPTSGTPILFDFCTSITSNGQCMRSHKQGNPLPGEWIQNADGQATSDPGALFTTPPGTIYPVGGASYGHKGFALGLWVEMMTAALTGHGRSESPKKWGASVYIQLMDPAAFGGTEAFIRESDFLVHASQASEPIATDEPVRLPGEMAWKRRKDQLENGIRLHPEILGSLKAWAEKWHIEMPQSK